MDDGIPPNDVFFLPKRFHAVRNRVQIRHRAHAGVAACRCIGACGLAPVLTVNDEVYGRLVPEDIPGIIAKYN